MKGSLVKVPQQSNTIDSSLYMIHFLKMFFDVSLIILSYHYSLYINRLNFFFRSRSLTTLYQFFTWKSGSLLMMWLRNPENGKKSWILSNLGWMYFCRIITNCQLSNSMTFRWRILFNKDIFLTIFLTRLHVCKVKNVLLLLLLLHVIFNQT
jgi:hypothetical protein